MSVIAKFRAGEKPGDAPSQATPPPAVEPDGDTLSAMDKRIAVRRVTPTRVAGAAIILVVLGVGGYGYARYGLERSMSVAAERLTISPVEMAQFREYMPVTGAVSPEDTVFLDTIEGGQVTEVLVDEGVIVEAGDNLARLKNTRLELEVIGREAQLTEQQNSLATARLAFQQSELRNQRDLMGVQREIDRVQDQLEREGPLRGEAIAEAAIQNLEDDLANLLGVRDSIEKSARAERLLAEQNLEKLQGSVDRMSESLTLVRGNLENLTITAPIAGQLTVFDLNVGEVVGAGQRLGQVDTIDAFKVVARVDEFYLSRIAIGQTATVEIGRQTYDMQVTKVYPNVQERQFEVDLEFAGAAPEGLRRGQTVRPRIELGESEQTLTVANGPFYDETGGVWALVVSADGSTATRRNVTLGRRNPEAVEVVSGLSEGERVITSSYQTYDDVERIDLH